MFYMFKQCDNFKKNPTGILSTINENKTFNQKQAGKIDN